MGPESIFELTPSPSLLREGCRRWSEFKYHPINYEFPKGLQITVEKNLVTIKGDDKQVVGQVAAEVRSFRPPEPYKGKGVKYVEEHIRRKAGKTAKK